MNTHQDLARTMNHRRSGLTAIEPTQPHWISASAPPEILQWQHCRRPKVKIHMYILRRTLSPGHRAYAQYYTVCAGAGVVIGDEYAYAKPGLPWPGTNATRSPLAFGMNCICMYTGASICAPAALPPCLLPVSSPGLAPGGGGDAWTTYTGVGGAGSIGGAHGTGPCTCP